MKTSFFKKHAAFLFALLLICGIQRSAFSQQPTVKAIPDTSKMTYNEISSKMKLFVYPSKGQTKDQQKIDEFECYKWSMEQSGIDPLNLPKTEPQKVEESTGGGARGAAKGALVGLAVGSVTGNAGGGAAVGAGIGAAKGAKQQGYVNARKQQEAQESAKATDQAARDSFIKGFSACMEGKGYTIK